MPALRPAPLQAAIDENLENRIREIQTTIKALIEDAAAREAAATGGLVPSVVIERQIWARANFCACRVWDEIKESQ